MASAGVVGMAEVVQPQSGTARFSGSPAMWAFIWAGTAALILVMLHMAITGRASR